VEAFARENPGDPVGPSWGWELGARRRSRDDTTLVRLLESPGEGARVAWGVEETFLRAEALTHLGRWEEAAAAWERVLEGDPEASARRTALLALGECAYRAGRLARAREAWGDALKESLGDTLRWHVVRSLAWLAREMGDTTAALEWTRRLLAQDLAPPVEAALRLDLAELLMAAGRYDEAASWLEPWRRATGADPRGDYLLGWSLLRLGDEEGAREAFQRVLSAREAPPPEWLPRVHAVLGWLFLRAGQPEAARVHYERSVRIQSEGARDAGNVYGLVLALEAQGRDAEALSEMEAWEGPVPRELTWAWSFARGYLLFRVGRFGEVSEALGPALSPVWPDSLRAWARILEADAQWKRGETAAARDGYAEASSWLEDPPEDLLWRWAVAELSLGRWGAASTLLQRLRTGYPGTPHLGRYAFWEGEALYRLGRFREAATRYRQALTLGAQPAAASYALGWCARRRGDDETAARWFREAVERGLDGEAAADAALRLGDALANLRRWDEAARAYARAVTLGQGTAREGVARFRRGWVLLRSGHPEAAAGVWEDLAARGTDPERQRLALYWAGQAWFQAGSFRKALERFQAAQGEGQLGDSLAAAAVLAQGDALFNLEDWDRARERYQRLLEDSSAPVRLRRAAADGIYATWVRQEAWEAAQRFLRRTEEIFPELARGGERHLEVAEGLLASGRPRAALEAYEALLRRQGLSRRLRRLALVGRAEALDALEAWGEAGRAWEEAARLQEDPRRLEQELRALERYARGGHPSEVVRLGEAIRSRLEETPWRVEAALARAYEDLDRRDAARSAWRRAVASAPTDSLRAVSWANIGRLDVWAQRWASARKAYARVDSLGWGEAFRTAYWIGEAWYQEGRWEEAERSLRAFLAEPREPLWEGLARMRRAACLEELGRLDEALEEYDRVLALELTPAVLEEARARRDALRARRAPGDSGKVVAEPTGAGEEP
jgi:tetratricopeptide (TPR) repeat protein